MVMAAFQRFTTQQVFDFPNTPDSRGIITDIASGGSVTVEALSISGTVETWTLTDTFIVSDAFEVYTRNLTLRITPSAGSAFAVDQSEMSS